MTNPREQAISDTVAAAMRQPAAPEPVALARLVELVAAAGKDLDRPPLGPRQEKP